MIARYKLLAAVALTATLTACGDEQPRDVPYYIANPTERTAMLESCKSDPAKARLRPNCESAGQAEIQASLKSTGMSSFK
ncbi:EexN family lipoprotein [Achromobacter ruhlandii]|uniref:EexN family lipoprotein n=1 Tax=Achromobacter ruhlandii TaxID=72557 RepID=UPI003B9EB701